MASRKLKLGLIGVAVFFFIAAVARSAQITEDGVTDFPWLNFTTGSSGPNIWLTDPDPIYFNNTAVEKDILLYPQQPASYIIWKDGSTYYAKSGTDGSIVSTSSNADVVIQYAIDQFNDYGDGPPYGGTIKILNGVYTLSAGLNLTEKTGLTLCGESLGGIEQNRGTALQLANGVDENIITLNGDASHFDYVTIKDLTLYGNEANQGAASHGIYLEKAKHVLIENVGIYDCNGTGLYLDVGSVIEVIKTTSSNNAEKGFYSSTNHINFIDCYATNNGNHGYQFGSNNNLKLISCHSDLNGVDGIYLYGTAEADIIACSSFENNQRGLFIRNAADNIQVIGGHYKDNSQAAGDHSGIDIYDANGTRIIGVRCYDSQGSATQKYGVEERGTSDYTLILGCMFSGHKTGAAILVGSNSQAHDNRGYTGAGDTRVSGTNLQMYNGTAWITIGSW